MSAMKLYRTARALHLRGVPVLPRILYRMIYLFHNTHLHYETQIGRGTHLAYGGIGVVIHKDAVIGENCVIESNVTIGGRNNCPRVPVIGDRVFIGSGARILGDVHVGSGSVIGANAVVLHDVPPRCTAAGVPARILHTDIEVDEKCNLSDIVGCG